MSCCVWAAAARHNCGASAQSCLEARGRARSLRRRVGGVSGRRVRPVLAATPGACLRAPHAAALSRRPAHALYFAAYEAAKKALGGSKEGHHPFAVAAAGVFATVTSDACMTPFDVVKQRLQVRCACEPCTVILCIDFLAAALRKPPCRNSQVAQQDSRHHGAGGEEPVQGRLGLRVKNTKGGGHRRIL